jgi:hypothetical protein
MARNKVRLRPIAAFQLGFDYCVPLPQTTRSSVAKHFYWLEVGKADFAGVHYMHLNVNFTAARERQLRQRLLY